MSKEKNEIYALIDESFISDFNKEHENFMKKIYYESYKKICKRLMHTPKSKVDFSKNMADDKIELYQLCCPFCKTVLIMHKEKNEISNHGFNYCVNCGRGSIIDNIRIQISRFIRIKEMNRIGLNEIEKKNLTTEKWILGYDSYQSEIIALSSIIEIVLRDYFESLIYISTMGFKNDYINAIIQQNTKTDFMNIERANTNYKKAFNINIKDHIDSEVWTNLIDIVNLRNMIVHNNGRIDNHFQKTKTYDRLKDKVQGSFFKLEDEDINKYLDSTIKSISTITELYIEEYFEKRGSIIANYYFNKKSLEDYKTYIHKT